MREPTLDEFVVKANHTLRIVNAVLVVTGCKGRVTSVGGSR